jgi:DNA-binding NtrC family response regulator
MAFYLPPLCQRPQDIEALARSLVARFADKFHKPLTGISLAALRALLAYSWPGNIRQLENVLQQAVLVSSGSELRPQHLPEPVRLRGSQMLMPLAATSPEGSPPALTGCRGESERQLIERVLMESGQSRSRAAHVLGISRVTLYKKMKKYGLMGPRSPCGQFTDFGGG